MIYFARSGKFVKIGCAANVESRLKSLQTGSAHAVRLVGTMPGSYKTEKELHHVFSSYRMMGEWFRITGKLETCLQSFSDHGRKHAEVKTVRELLENGMHLRIRQKAKRNHNLRQKVKEYAAV